MDNRVLLSFPSIEWLKETLENDKKNPGTTDWVSVAENYPSDYYLLKSGIFLAAYYQQETLLYNLSDRFLSMPFLQGGHVVEFISLELPHRDKAALLAKNNWLNKTLRIGGEDGLHATPLVVAITFGQYGLLQALIEAGADVFAPVLRSKGGASTLLDYAYECDFQLASELLFSMGVKSTEVNSVSLHYSMGEDQMSGAVASPDALLNTWEYLLPIYAHLPLTGIAKTTAVLSTMPTQLCRKAILETLFNQHLFLSGILNVSIETQLCFWNEILSHPISIKSMGSLVLGSDNGIPLFDTNTTLGTLLQLNVCHKISERISDPASTLAARSLFEDTLLRGKYARDDIVKLPISYSALVYEVLSEYKKVLSHNKEKYMVQSKAINNLLKSLEDALLEYNAVTKKESVNV